MCVDIRAESREAGLKTIDSFFDGVTELSQRGSLWCFVFQCCDRFMNDFAGRPRIVCSNAVRG